MNTVAMMLLIVVGSIVTGLSLGMIIEDDQSKRDIVTQCEEKMEFTFDGVNFMCLKSLDDEK